MSQHWTCARGLGLLSVITTMLLLFGISCSSVTSPDVSKSVSTMREVSGTVFCDHDNDGDLDGNDHPMVGWPVLYKIEGNSTTYSAYTNSSGQYIFYHDGADYVDVWMIPGPYQPHWRKYYDRTDGTPDWANPNPTVHIDADYGVPLSFIGSNYTP